MSNVKKSPALPIALAALVIAVAAALYSIAAPRMETGDAAFGDKVRAYLMENPEVLRDALISLSQQEESNAAAERVARLSSQGDALMNDGYSHVAGNPEGDVTIVEFFDYSCGYCKKSFPDLMQAVQEDGNVRLVLKEFPILGPQSILASQAAIAAQAQERYMPFHIALMEARGSLTKERIFTIAEEAGLDIKQLEADMGAPRTREIIERNHALAEALGINGTPAFIIGEHLIPGAISLDDMRKVIAVVREQAAEAGATKGRDS